MEQLEKVRILREWSGEGIMTIGKALNACNGDLLMAAGYLKYDGCLINTTNKNWVMDMAKGFSQEVALTESGKIAYKKDL